MGLKQLRKGLQLRNISSHKDKNFSFYATYFFIKNVTKTKVIDIVINIVDNFLKFLTKFEKLPLLIIIKSC